MRGSCSVHLLDWGFSVGRKKVPRLHKGLEGLKKGEGLKGVGYGLSVVLGSGRRSSDSLVPKEEGPK